MDYKQKLLNIISGLSVLPADEIAPEDKFTDIGIDSLKIVELIVTVEDELNIKFDDSELNPGEIVMVKNIMDLTEKYAM